MRLTQDHSAGAFAVDVPCIICGHMMHLSDCVYDLDGPAYIAYYHVECLPANRPKIQPCGKFGCRIDKE